MHSSFLRGSDFRITHQREEVSHARFFRDLSATDRVGVFAPGGIDGLGACLLLLAHTTAFYDRYRATGDEFFAYPDHYTFQRRTPRASYSMLDVWPGHKDVPVADDVGETLDAILDRAINVLVVPGRERRSRRVHTRADGQRPPHHPSVLHVLGDRVDGAAHARGGLRPRRAG